MSALALSGKPVFNAGRTTITITVAGATAPMVVSNATGFSLTGSARTIASAAAGSGSTVVLTLSGASVSTESVQLGYNTGTGAVVDSAGTPNTLATFTGQYVQLTAPGSQTLVLGVPVFNTGRTTITIPITGGTAPYLITNATGFSIAGSARTISSAAISTTNVVLTLSGASAASENPSITYSPTLGNLIDSANVANTPAVITSVLVANASSGTGAIHLLGNPRLNSARTTITFNTSGLTSPLVANNGGGFTLTGTTRTISSVAVATNVVTITLSGAATPQENLFLSYNPAFGGIVDSAGTPNTLAAFTGRDVFRIDDTNANTKRRANGMLKFGMGLGQS